MFSLNRTLGGIELGASLSSVLAIPGFAVEPDDPDPVMRVEGAVSVARHNPEVTAELSDGVVWSIAAWEECWLGGTNIVGAQFEDVEEMLGGVAKVLDGREPLRRIMMQNGLEVWIKADRVSVVMLADDSLILD